MDTFEITVKTPVERQRVYDLLVSGIECGAPYSSFLVDEGDWKEAWTAADKGAHNAFGLISLVDRYEYEEYEEGDDELPQFRMGDAALINGLKTMAEFYPRHFQDFHNENDDAITADVFLQCVCLGEVVYG